MTKLRSLLLIAPPVLAAAASFEVASLKPHPEPITMSAGPSVKGTRVTATALTLVDLVTWAYRVDYDQIEGGPAWAHSDHYDLSANADPATQSREMMQDLLATRFHLRVHRETREVPLFALVVGKSGHKLTTSSADAKGSSFVSSKDGALHMVYAKGTMEQLARQLSNTAGRPVVDRTGLSGLFAWNLDWIPPNSTAEADSNTPSMFTAIQEQLGLRLDPIKGPLEKLVVDGAEKPTEN